MVLAAWMVLPMFAVMPCGAVVNPGFFEFEGSWFPNFTQTTMFESVTILNPGAPAWNVAADVVVERVTMVNTGAMIWDAGSTGTEFVTAMGASANTAVEAAAVSLDIPVVMEMGVGTAALAQAETMSWGLSSIPLAQVATLLGVGLASYQLASALLNSAYFQAWMSGHNLTQQGGYIGTVTGAGQLQQSQLSGTAPAWPNPNNGGVTVCQGPFDNAADALTAAHAAAGAFQGGPFTTTGSTWTGGAWHFYEVVNGSGAGSYQDFLYCDSSTWYTGSPGGGNWTLSTSGTIASYFTSDLASHNHNAIVAAAQGIESLQPAWQNAANGSYTGISQPNWQTTSQILANNMPSGYYSAQQAANGGAGFVAAQNSQNTTPGSNPNNPIYTSSAGGGSTYNGPTDASMTQDVENALQGYGAPTDGSMATDVKNGLDQDAAGAGAVTGLTAEANPTAPEQQSITGILGSYVSSVAKFGPSNMLSSIAPVTAGGSSVISIPVSAIPALGMAAFTITLDASNDTNFGINYMLLWQLCGTSFYWFMVVRWTKYVFTG
jgi:hypothetical protein